MREFLINVYRVDDSKRLEVKLSLIDQYISEKVCPLSRASDYKKNWLGSWNFREEPFFFNWQMSLLKRWSDIR